MPYIFNLHIEKEKSRLALLDDGKEVASKEWNEGRDMGRRLFSAIDELLAEQGIGPEDVADFEIDSDIPDGYMSMRIAETVKKTYTFGVASLRSDGAGGG
jgi:tRNA A37 threonylcarbamoyladenosine modification protein TsaB